MTALDTRPGWWMRRSTRPIPVGGSPRRWRPRPHAQIAGYLRENVPLDRK